MNHFNDMPPLGPDEAPWANHEVQFREVLGGAEETPPAGLEARIWEALDAPSFQPSATNRTPWIAAAVAGTVVVASLWMTSGKESQQPAATIPVEVSTEQAVEPVQQLFVKPALEVAPSNDRMVEQQPSEVAIETSQAAAQTKEKVTDRQKLEVMTELESSAIPAKLGLNRTPIQSPQTHGDTVRLQGTLKLKQ